MKGVMFWENRKKKESETFLCTIERKTQVLRKRGGNQEQGRRAKRRGFL